MTFCLPIWATPKLKGVLFLLLFILFFQLLPQTFSFLPQHFSLVGNVADMSPRVVVMPTMLTENGQRHNVTDAMTGFVAGSCVGLDIYLVFFT